MTPTPIATDEFLVAAFVDDFPKGVVVEKVDEEIVGQLALAVGQHAKALILVIGSQHAQPADQNGHFRARETKQGRLVEQ